MNLVMKSARRNKGLIELLRLRRVLLINMLLKNVKLVRQIKLRRKTMMEIFVRKISFLRMLDE